MMCWAPTKNRTGGANSPSRGWFGWCGSLTLGLAVALPALPGCSWLRPGSDLQPISSEPLVVVVAPVLNLSNSTDWDPIRLTDTVASELASFEGIAVVPVNRVLAMLASEGKRIVETPADALALATALGADATVVTAITEYEPYDPPRVGILMQWYEHPRRQRLGSFDPVVASRSAGELSLVSDERGGAAPTVQVQHVVDASRAAVLEDLERYGTSRMGTGSAYGWQRHMKNQELFLRYASHATIASMLEQRMRLRSPAVPNGEEP